MDNNKKNFNYPFKYILIHAILSPISYALDILTFTIILCLKFRSFFISCYIVQVLVIIFMIKLLCLFKTKFDSTDNIKCNIILYFILSFISLVFVAIEYILIFKNLNLQKNMDKKSKFSFIIISIIYHIYHNFNFIYECYIIIKAVKKSIDERIEGQMAERRDGKEKNRNETQSSEKPKKVESFIKEDTIYIIHGKINENSIHSDNKDNVCDIKNIKNNKNKNNSNSERQLNKEDIKELNNNNNNSNKENTIISNEDCFNKKTKIKISNLKQ